MLLDRKYFINVEEHSYKRKTFLAEVYLIKTIENIMLTIMRGYGVYLCTYISQSTVVYAFLYVCNMLM